MIPMVENDYQGLSSHELHKDDMTVLVTDKFNIEEVSLETVTVSTLVVEAELETGFSIFLSFDSWNNNAMTGFQLK